MAASHTFNGNGLEVKIFDPDNITKDECLRLARAGRDAWNMWRLTYPARHDAPHGSNTADFHDVDLREKPIDFSGFKFGDHATFENAQLADSSQFGNAEFGHWTRFDGANLGHSAKFDGARFGNWAHFDGSRFAFDASFVGAQFGNPASFAGAEFGTWTSFRGAQFLGHADFSGAKFSGSVNFQATEWNALGEIYGRDLMSSKSWSEDHGTAPDSFPSLSFNGATFTGDADFTGRKFLQRTSFAKLPLLGKSGQASTIENDASGGRIELDGVAAAIPVEAPTRFLTVPIFHGCELHQDTSFDGAKFRPPTGREYAARAYRTLKLAFAQQHAIREEQRFFKLEMQEEAAREVGWKSRLYRYYEFFSDFGFSIWRPLARLVLWPGLGFAIVYLILIVFQHPELQQKPRMSYPNFVSQWLQFSFANMLPLPDSSFLNELRGSLFGKGSLMAVLVLVLESLQKLAALGGFFLIGLALRNLFKMK